jgi:hypothetical protein
MQLAYDNRFGNAEALQHARREMLCTKWKCQQSGLRTDFVVIAAEYLGQLIFPWHSARITVSFRVFCSILRLLYVTVLFINAGSISFLCHMLVEFLYYPEYEAV